MNRFWAMLFVAVPILAIAIFVASAFNIAPLTGTWMPEQVSQQSETIDWLYLLFHVVAAFTLAFTGLLLFLAMFRSRPDGTARFIRGNTKLEIVWTVIPAAALIFLAIYQSEAWTSNKFGVPDQEPLTARVIARQYQWEFVYPGEDGVFGNGDDLRSINRLIVPQKKHVVLELESHDVIHSFFVPKLRLKQDMVPGTVARVWFSPTKTAELEILCAELCGWGHYNMRASMQIVSPAEFDSFLLELNEPVQSEDSQ